MTTDRTDTAAFIRGKLHMAGVGYATPITTALDVITVLVMDVPKDDLKKWRRELDQALWKVRPPDRSQWGLRPQDQASTQRLVGPAPKTGVADTRAAPAARPAGHRDDRFRPKR